MDVNINPEAWNWMTIISFAARWLIFVPMGVVRKQRWMARYRSSCYRAALFALGVEVHAPFERL